MCTDCTVSLGSLPKVHKVGYNFRFVYKTNMHKMTEMKCQSLICQLLRVSIIYTQLKKEINKKEETQKARRERGYYTQLEIIPSLNG